MSSKVVEAATSLRWLFTAAAGVEQLPWPQLRERGVRVSNGAGLSASNVADYAVMGILLAAKGYHEVLQAQTRREWLQSPPVRQELEESRALIIGYGAIGAAIGRRLQAFGVSVTGVRSRPDLAKGILGPADWRPRLGEFDWIVLAAPATSATAALISYAELAALRPRAWLLNFARGSLVSRHALLEALAKHRIGGAFLDVTDPEPLAADDAYWSMPNTLISMHLAGRSETRLYTRATRLFLANLDRFSHGEDLENEVDAQRGY